MKKILLGGAFAALLVAGLARSVDASTPKQVMKSTIHLARRWMGYANIVTHWTFDKQTGAGVLTVCLPEYPCAGQSN